VYLEFNSASKCHDAWRETEGRESEKVNSMFLTSRLWTKKDAWKQTKEGMHPGVDEQVADKDDRF